MADTPYRPRGAVGILPFVSFVGTGLLGAGSSNLAKTNALVWVMIAIGAAGAFVTFAFLVYAIWKFRDPNARRRKYG